MARQRLGLLEAMEPVDTWTEKDVMDAIQQWKGIAVGLAQILELEREDAPSVPVIATLEEELNEDWQAVWTTLLDDLRMAGRLDAPSMDVGQTGTSVLNWRNTLVGWLQEREKKTYLFSARCYCFPVPRRRDGANFCSRKKPELRSPSSSTPKTIANARCTKRG